MKWTSRLYKCEQDLLAMLDMLMEGRKRTDDWHYAHVGEFLFNFFMVTCHLDPCQHIRLWHDKTGKIIAYCILGEDPSFDFQVSPDYEWCGIELEAYDWAQSYLTVLRQRQPALWSESLVSGSRENDSLRINFLESRGFRYSGKFAEVNMLRSLNASIPELVIQPGRKICSMAEMTGISDRAAIQREVWQPWTVGNVSDSDYDIFMQLPCYHPDLDVVALTPDGIIAAYVNGWIDPVNRIGDFGPVGARLEYRQQGYTRLVLLESLRRMKGYGMEEVCISTGIQNTPALKLYESVGFKVVNRYLDYVKADPL